MQALAPLALPLAAGGKGAELDNCLIYDKLIAPSSASSSGAQGAHRELWILQKPDLYRVNRQRS